MGQPALLTLAAYGGGIVIGQFLSVPPLFLLWAVSCGLALWVGLVLIERGREIRTPILLAALVLAGLVRYELATDYFSSAHLSRFAGLPFQVRLAGTVIRDPVREPWRTTVLVRAFRLGVGSACVHVDGLVQGVGAHHLLGVSYGDLVEMRGVLEVPSPARNPGGFDRRRYLAQRGVYGVMRIADPDGIAVICRGGGNPVLRCIVCPVRRYVSCTLDRWLRGDPRAVIGALLLGDREGLPGYVESWFRTSGMIHVLAVSGLHVGILALIATLFLRGVGLPRTAASLLTAVLLVAYAPLTGLRPSVIRAVALFGMGSIALTLDRRFDRINLLAAIALAILVAAPRALHDLGFQLSFLATFSILFVFPRLLALLPAAVRSGSSPAARICQALGVSVAAQLGTAPLVAYHFFRLPLLAPLANLVVIPLVGLAIALSLATVTSGLISSVLGQVFAAAEWAVLTLLLAAVRFVSRVECASLRLPAPHAFSILMYYLTLVILCRATDGRCVRRVALIWLLILAQVWVWHGVFAPCRTDLRAIFLDVGQGDAMVITGPGGRVMVVDGGPAFRDWSAGEAIVAPYLWSQGHRSIDVLVATHPDADHLGGLVYLVEEFDVEVVLDSGLPGNSPTYRRFVEKIRRRGIPYYRIRAGDRIEGIGAAVRVLHPPRGWGTDGVAPPANRNDWSVVLAIDWGEWTILLTGDLERTEGILDVVERDGRSILLKVPHHGGEDANSEEFASGIGAEVAVISVGARNRFGLPDPRVVERYRRTGSAVLRTDLVGAIRAGIDGQHLVVDGMVDGGSSPYRDISRAWSWDTK